MHFAINYLIDELNSGTLKSNINFEFGAQTGSLRSCSAMLSGRMLIIGGLSSTDYTNQISEVVGCSLKRIGSMPTATQYPACNTFNTPTPKVWICFYSLNIKGCKRFVSKLLFHVRNLFRRKFRRKFGRRRTNGDSRTLFDVAGSLRRIAICTRRLAREQGSGAFHGFVEVFGSISLRKRIH